jgi:hypothetical protein
MSQTLLPSVRRFIALSSSSVFDFFHTLLLNVLTFFLLAVVACILIVQAAEAVTFVTSLEGGLSGKLACICFQALVGCGFAAMLDQWEDWDED